MLGFVLKHYRQGAFDSIEVPGSRVRTVIWKYAAAVAAAAAVVLLVFLFRANPTVKEFTANNAPLRVELPDCSSLFLSPGTTVRYSDSKTGRAVEMEGTALFNVARDESRPFKVDAGHSEVEVLGTVFQVKQSSGDIFVDVMEGKVQFSGGGNDVVLTAGMESVLRQGTESPEIIEAPLPNPTAWLTGEFKYEATPLGTVLTELSEFFGKEFTARPGEGEKTLTGTFSTEDPELIAEAISAALGSKITIR